MPPLQDKKIENNVAFANPGIFSSTAVLATTKDNGPLLQDIGFASTVGALAQITLLSIYAHDMFERISSDVQNVSERVNKMNTKFQELQSPTTLNDVDNDNEAGGNYEILQELLLRPETISKNMFRRYKSIYETPDYTQIASVMADGKVSSDDLLKRFSDPTLFFAKWQREQEQRLKTIQEEKEKARAERKARKEVAEKSGLKTPKQANATHLKRISWKDRFEYFGKQEQSRIVDGPHDGGDEDGEVDANYATIGATTGNNNNSNSNRERLVSEEDPELSGASGAGAVEEGEIVTVIPSFTDSPRLQVSITGNNSNARSSLKKSRSHTTSTAAPNDTAGATTTTTKANNNNNDDDDDDDDIEVVDELIEDVAEDSDDDDIEIVDEDTGETVSPTTTTAATAAAAAAAATAASDAKKVLNAEDAAVQEMIEEAAQKRKELKASRSNGISRSINVSRSGAIGNSNNTSGSGGGGGTAEEERLRRVMEKMTMLLEDDEAETAAQEDNNNNNKDDENKNPNKSITDSGSNNNNNSRSKSVLEVAGASESGEDNAKTRMLSNLTTQFDRSKRNRADDGSSSNNNNSIAGGLESGARGTPSRRYSAFDLLNSNSGRRHSLGAIGNNNGSPLMMQSLQQAAFDSNLIGGGNNNSITGRDSLSTRNLDQTAPRLALMMNQFGRPDSVNKSPSIRGNNDSPAKPALAFSAADLMKKIESSSVTATQVIKDASVPPPPPSNNNEMMGSPNSSSFRKVSLEPSQLLLAAGNTRSMRGSTTNALKPSITSTPLKTTSSNSNTTTAVAGPPKLLDGILTAKGNLKKAAPRVVEKQKPTLGAFGNSAVSGILARRKFLVADNSDSDESDKEDW